MPDIRAQLLYMLPYSFPDRLTFVSWCSLSVFFVQFYLVESKLSIMSANRQERFIPGAFEVDGIYQHQPGQAVQYVFGHRIFDFTWWKYWNHMEPMRDHSNVSS